MKKLVSLCLVFIILSTMLIPTYASENEDNRVSAIKIYTPDTFERVFTDGQHDNRRLPRTENVTYSYSIAPCEDRPNESEVQLEFSFIVDDQVFTFETTGIVNAYKLDNGNVLWEGPIRGCKTINGVEYSVIAGFAKMNSNPAVQVNATIQGKNETDGDKVVLLSFGATVITQAIYEELVRETNLAVAPSNEANVAQTRSFVQVGSDTANFDNLNAGTAQEVVGYFDSITNQFAISIKTHCANLENWANRTSTINANTYVHSFEINLATNTTTPTGHSWIDNVNSFDFGNSNFNTVLAVLVKSLFEDILSLLGVPTSTISTMLDGLKGNVDKNIDGDDATVSVSFGLAQKADFDESSAGIPIVFQLDCVPSTYVGNSSYTFSSNICYRTWWWPSSYNTPEWFYRDAYEASKTVTITLSN